MNPRQAWMSTTSLDVLELCRSLADEGCSVVIATHDLNGACRFVNQVALIDSGMLIGTGTPPVCPHSPKI